MSYDEEVRITKWDDIQVAEKREYNVEQETLEHPSSIVHWIDCPWCRSEVKAYLWSLSGGGKRCTCGAIFGTGGMAWKKRRTE